MLAMRQTFQQWMVLLSALVLLLLPALLCYAAPMDSGAPSSSGARPQNSGIMDFEYYGTARFGAEPNRQPLPSNVLDQLFGTHIHYGGAPVLFTKHDPESIVKDALVSHKKIWLAGPPSTEIPNKYRYVGLEYLGEGNHRYNTPTQAEIHAHVLEAHEFRGKHGDNALYLRFGRPFTKQKGRLHSSYQIPTWEKVKASKKLFHLRQTRLADLRNHLNKENYLLAYDSVRREHLGFALDKDGGVIFENLGEYVRRA